MQVLNWNPPQVGEGVMSRIEQTMHQALGGRNDNNAVHQAAQAAHYHLDCGGQRLRARLAVTSALALEISMPDAITLAASAELVHNASLVHDDLVDHEEYRRGSKTVAVAFGSTVAICTGDLLLSAAYVALGGFSRSARISDLLRLVHRAAAAAIQGQCSEFAPSPNHVDAWKNYENIAKAKSGALLALPLELAMATANRTDCIPIARRCAEAFAIAYQIVDDINDLSKDRGNGVSPACYNALLTLEAAGHGENTFAMASELATSRLLESIELAKALPDQSGGLLVALGNEMLREIP
jgi:geranylgeranyl pyrophosphate synthase